MGRTKYDADTLGREYATLRAAAGGVLTQQAFYRSKGIPEKYGPKKFGRILDGYWERTRARAAMEISKRNGINLAREMADLFAQHKELARRGYAKITTGPGGKGLEPDDMDEALALFNHGSFGLRDIVKILSGGQAVQPPKNVAPEFRWNEPTKPSQKTRKKKHGRR